MLFTCLKRNDKREVKVAQLAGSVAEMSAYHHGEVQSVFLRYVVSKLAWDFHQLYKTNNGVGFFLFIHLCELIDFFTVTDHPLSSCQCSKLS